MCTLLWTCSIIIELIKEDSINRVFPWQARAEAAEKSLSENRARQSQMDEAAHDFKRRCEIVHWASEGPAKM